MRAQQDKYIDLNQFPHNKNGNISWKDSVGIVAEFFYNGERHTIEIVEYLFKDYLLVKLDSRTPEKWHTTKIKNLSLEQLFYKPEYLYNVGDVVDNLIILEQCYIERKANVRSGVINRKTYKCRCLIDKHEWFAPEDSLRNGHGCPVCSNTVIIKGVNDIATTDSDLVRFFANKEDAYKYSRKSMTIVKAKCPYCGFEKDMRVSELSRCGRVTCDMCSNGISYPNKFAHELFSQLSNQCLEYRYEYSPDWAGKYRYDNYIKLLNGDEIFVEMDGGFHYAKSNCITLENDKNKDFLAAEHNIAVIRIDCNYVKTGSRYSYIKSNVIQCLSPYFDLSVVNWDRCNEIGNSNCLVDVINYYKDNPRLGLTEIALHFKISKETLYNYLYVGESLGLCVYIRNDPSRMRNSKPIAMYDLNGDLIGVFKSAKQIAETFPQKEFQHRSIRKQISRNKPYKGYVFKFATYEEYQSFDDNDIKKFINDQ